MQVPRVVPLTCAAMLLLLAACSSTRSNDVAPSGSPAEQGAAGFELEECGDGVDCGYLTVPVDYANERAGTMRLYTAIRRANDQDNRVGSLLVNPGGPGFGGSDFAFFADQIYGPALLERFDLVAWDPRGTGKSEPAIDCIDDYDLYYAEPDITPDDAAETQAVIDSAKAFQDACAAKNAEIIQFVGTNNAARDMDALRDALGEETISYFGFSYGSELGAVWATLFPETVRAAVLDGAADPNADYLQSGLQQAAGFEKSIATFLERCQHVEGLCLSQWRSGGEGV